MVKTNTKKIKRKAAEEKSVSSTEELMTANDQVGLPENQEEGIVEKDGKNQKPADLDEKVLSLELKLAELNDKLLRAMAETENIRRRAHRDKEDSLKYGIRNFAEKMVVIADNIRRGIQSIDVEIRKKDSALEKVVIGFEMVERELLNSLSTFGVTPIDSIGQRFDPMFHEAMFEIENPNEVTGTIVQVLETGYKIHDRTLRAA